MTQSHPTTNTHVDWENRFENDDAPWERKTVHPALNDWINSGDITPKSRILIPGAGRSLEPLSLARLGLDVTIIDMAPTAIGWQETQFSKAGLNAEIVCTDGLAYRPEKPFDLIYEQTFLCAIHPRLRTDYETMAHAALRPNGAYLALFMQKDDRGGPPYGCSIPAMKKLFLPQRWAWPDHHLTPYPHPGLNSKAELGGVLTRIGD